MSLMSVKNKQKYIDYKKVKNIVTSHTLKKLHNSLILPYINYCCQ